MSNTSRLLAAVVVLVGVASPVRAAAYGDVDVTVESEPKGTATHGYAELWLRVANRSPDKARTVRLTFPKSGGGTWADHLRGVTRTVTVEPGKTARVALAFPEKLATGGGVGVAIDGRDQDDEVRLAFSRSMSSSRYGSSHYGSSGSGGTKPLILYSRAVDTQFPDWVNAGSRARRGMAITPPVAGGGEPGAPPEDDPPPAHLRDALVSEVLGWGGGATGELEFDRADQPAAAWSPNWLGYSRYDGVVVTAADLRAMPAEVRAAVGQYVECGGSLLVLGADPPLPGKWKPDRPGKQPFVAHAAGFGVCFVAAEPDLRKWRVSTVGGVTDSWAKTLAPWHHDPTPIEANRLFPVTESAVPVKGLLVVMFVFAVVIGPINLFVLARRRRKLWQFWTVPLVSFATCLAVFGYMAATEGWSGRARAEAFTVLDENSRRAATIGWTGYYTPLLPGGGLHFSPETELAFRNGEERHGYYPRRRGSAAALTMDWTTDQHLSSGWLTPRVPAHFAVRKGESRRERVTITKAADGRPEAVNGLGADVTELWYMDEAGALFRSGAVAAGGKATLAPATRPGPAGVRLLPRDVYAGEWPNVVARVQAAGPSVLTPRTYLAVLDAAPFLDDAMPKASARKARSVVLGVLRDSGE